LVRANADGAFILFMSPSAVRATVKSVASREQLTNLKVISIGPSTTRALGEQGLSVYAEAAEHSENGVVHCLSECLKLA
jgi:uroporphyrinogen-III synthase